MKTNRLSISRWLAIAAAGIFILSLFTPYRDFNNTDYSTGVDEFEFIFPFMSLWVIAPLTVLALMKHTQLSKWLMLTFSILLFFPTIPFQYAFFTYSQSHIESKPGIGFYLLVVSAVIFLAAAVLKSSLPTEEAPKESTNILDSF